MSDADAVCVIQVSVYFHLLHVMTWYLMERAGALLHTTAFGMVLSFLIETGGLCGWGQW